MDNIYFNSDSAVKKLSVSGKDYLYYDISSLDKSGDRLSRLPFPENSAGDLHCEI